jgi:uncharacterized cofD-like protein
MFFEQFWSRSRYRLTILFLGVLLIILAAFFTALRLQPPDANLFWTEWYTISVFFVLGVIASGIALQAIVLAPAQATVTTPAENSTVLGQRARGPRMVAIGGGTGLPSALRAMKTQTHDLTAVVTVADDGGSSGRLRRDMGVQPPGDLRNNIVALADDESLMAKLFQYRFTEGDLKGHSFGNLFISALTNITDGGLETALIETARVLNIQGRVLPSTLQDVNLRAKVRLPNQVRSVTIFGEAAIGEAGGKIEHLELVPADVQAYPGSVEAILNAEIVVIGPGSLYTSILPNLLVPEIANALRATTAYIVYICNVATQPGETDEYTVAEHAMAIEQMTGRGVFQAVLANNSYPPPPPGVITDYVMPVPDNHQVLQRYEIVYTDLTDAERPWRHDPTKLSRSLMALYESERYGKPLDPALFAEPIKTR